MKVMTTELDPNLASRRCMSGVVYYSVGSGLRICWNAGCWKILRVFGGLMVVIVVVVVIIIIIIIIITNVIIISSKKVLLVST